MIEFAIDTTPASHTYINNELERLTKRSNRLKWTMIVVIIFVILVASGFGFAFAIAFDDVSYNSVFASILVGSISLIYYIPTISNARKRVTLSINLLAPIDKSDAPELIRFAEKYDEIKSYLKAVAALERLPVKNEYAMLSEFAYSYADIKLEEKKQAEAARAFELIRSGAF
ncbi:MAG TPA: hypothetical protein PK528_13330 [Syntrophorhabdus sp.]|nr:hypothetical protein [Syntrophorhabdus sp.]